MIELLSANLISKENCLKLRILGKLDILGVIFNLRFLRWAELD